MQSSHGLPPAEPSVKKLSQVEQALREKDQRFRDIVETSADWIWEVDARGHYVFSSGAVKTMLGYQPNSLLGKFYLDLVHPDDRAAVEQAYERMKREGYGMTGIVARWRTKSGEYRWLEKNALPLLDKQSGFLGYRGTDRDITERKIHEITGQPKLKMDTQLLEQLALADRLEHALAREQFVLHYQPTFSLGTGRIESVEALIRWNLPEVGMVAPGRFIPLLEATGKILEVGEWALKQAASQLLQWREKGLPPLRVAVNVSPVQLKHSEFVPAVLSVLGRGTARSVDLDLEITESMLMGDIDESVYKLQRLREAGVGIALDDFGTGFSSLSRLAKLPIDTLKVDRSFVSEIATNQSLRAVVTTIVSLAQAFDMKAVAEGVETEQQLELLRKLGCDSIQGYLISPPVPADEFETLFREKNAVL